MSDDQFQNLYSNLHARIGGGGKLMFFYLTLALTTGLKTTSRDVFLAWLMWIRSQRGVPGSDVCEGEYHERIAFAIREAARYAGATP